jgi:hypothetical protein
LFNEKTLFQFSKLSLADSLNNLENDKILKLMKDKILFLKDDLRVVRDNTKFTLNDSIYEKKIEQGETKYSTLNKV